MQILCIPTRPAQAQGWTRPGPTLGLRTHRMGPTLANPELGPAQALGGTCASPTLSSHKPKIGPAGPTLACAGPRLDLPRSHPGHSQAQGWTSQGRGLDLRRSHLGPPGPPPKLQVTDLGLRRPRMGPGWIAKCACVRPGWKQGGSRPGPAQSQGGIHSGTTLRPRRPKVGPG